MRLRFRRCSRFTLRGLLCTITIICIWASLNANRAYEQRRAVTAVTELGGKVTSEFDSFGSGDGVLRSWVRRRLFYSFCEPVVYVNLAACDVTDSDLSCLEDLPDLKMLNLTGNRRLRGNGLRYIRGLRGIETLQAQVTGLGDDAVPHMLSLGNVRELYLGDTMIGDTGVSLIRQMKSIETLELSKTDITDDALRSIRGLPQLHELCIAGTNVTDSGLRELEEMASLKKLVLRSLEFSGENPVQIRCPVTAEGVAVSVISDRGASRDRWEAGGTRRESGPR